MGEMAALYINFVYLIGSMLGTWMTRKRGLLAPPSALGKGAGGVRLPAPDLLPRCNSPRRVMRVCGRSFSHSDTNDAIPSKVCPNSFNRVSKPFWMGTSCTPDGTFARTAALS